MHNIANMPQNEKDKINADLAASGIAYKERLGLPYDLYETENQQPEHLRPYFRERLEHYREVSAELPESGKQWLRDRIRENKGAADAETRRNHCSIRGQ
ncbi:DNA polymerase III subunit theta [Morganella morganii]|uniref:DNA polymerase III subunit theta n=1 Tax=Morganella morganii TaxID=582 RepID=UPI0021AE1578|nr:DNA polymerase III subunit theta [Morganella morganii]